MPETVGGEPTIRRSVLFATVVVSLVVLPPAAGAAACPHVCGIFQHSCARVQPAKLRLCRAKCTFDSTPPLCRDECRDYDDLGACRQEARRCREHCEGIVESICTRSCAEGARGCLRDNASWGRSCLAACSEANRPERLECRENCLLDVEDEDFKCLRAAPVCIRAAQRVYGTCRSSCLREPSVERVRCKHACKRQYAEAVHTCLAHPERGLFACVARCAASPVGAFVGLRRPGSS